MMKRAVSNLAFPGSAVDGIAPILTKSGISGVEVAATAIWPNAPQISPKEVRAYANQWEDWGIRISGIQSLFYGHPRYQIFDRESWRSTFKHLRSTFEIGRELGADVAVFGSPKNRVRGSIPIQEAHHICAEWLSNVVPVLAECAITLTVEPNAPAYGADYLTDYSQVLTLVDLLDSPWVKPQIDTGCLLMVGDDPAAAAVTRTPAHVHVSAPHLKPPPAGTDNADFESLNDALTAGSYSGWVVLEMLNPGSHVLGLQRTYDWLTRTFH